MNRSGMFLGLVLVALVNGCQTAQQVKESNARANRTTLKTHTWNVEARPERGQGEAQIQSDWQICEDEVVTDAKVDGPGYFWGGVVLYKDFEGCMRNRGYKLVEKGK